MDANFLTDLLNNQAGSLLALFIGLVLLVYIAISAVLIYHWVCYGIHKKTIWAVMIIYFAVSLILLTVIGGAALAIN